MLSIGSTPTFTENDKFDRTNWASWRRLIRLAANQRSAIGYLEGSITHPIRARNTSVPSKPSATPAPATPTETPWSSTSPSLEEWTNRDAWTMGLLLFNTKDAVGCYDLITQVATLDLRLEDELGVRGRECTID